MDFPCMSSANSNGFTSSFLIWIPFSFSCLIVLARTSNTMLKKSGEKRHLLAHLWGKAFSFSPLSMTLVVVLSLCLVESGSLQPHGLWPAWLLCPWDFPARILEWGAVSSSRGSCSPKDLVSPALAGRFFPTSATWEAQPCHRWPLLC